MVGSEKYGTPRQRHKSISGLEICSVILFPAVTRIFMQFQDILFLFFTYIFYNFNVLCNSQHECKGNIESMALIYQSMVESHRNFMCTFF